MPIEKALEYGNAAGALATTVRGDIEAQPTWRDLETFMQSRGKEILLR
jgi:sugar/nucleoside kinase (ribokinase family)